MFSDTYAKFKSFFEEGACLYVSGEYKQRFNSEEMEFRVSDVRLMESIGAEKTNSVTLKIPVERISQALIDQIESLCKAHKGKHDLKMELIDYQNKERLFFTSLAKKVQVNNDFLLEIEKLGVEYGVN
jgi:DNA polymerase-3 subunit alpha